jgi:hypothetical protein
MSKIRVTQVREMEVDLDNYKNMIMFDEDDPFEAEPITLTEPEEILTYEKEAVESGEFEWEDMGTLIRTDLEWIED